MQVGETGKAVGIDHIPELVEESIKHIKKDKLTRTLLESERIMLVSGDGRKGYPSEGPYDAIHVGAASPILPEPVSFKQYFSYIVAVSFIDGGNWSTQRKPLSFIKSLTNFIT